MQQHAQMNSSLQQISNLNSALLHKTDLLHVIALVVDDAFWWDNFFSEHNRQALYSVSRQILELRHLQTLLKSFPVSIACQFTRCRAASADCMLHIQGRLVAQHHQAKGIPMDANLV